MILYCDTSALVKLYVEEQYSDWTRRQTALAGACLVSQLTWVETCAAFGLKRRIQEISLAEQRSAMKRLTAEWTMFTRLAIDTKLLDEAGELALKMGFRAYDSMQLASACRAFQQAGRALSFCCFDKQLNKAANELGLIVLSPGN
jgi:uncharacterized protein